MTNTTCDHSMESLNPSQKTFRSQSAIQAHRGDVPSKHDEYLIQLQERNRLLKAHHNQRQPKNNHLKKRETGFQLYLNGAHCAPPRRPTSITTASSNRTVITPSPYFSDFSFPTPSNTTQPTNSLPSNGRRRWVPSTKTKIKTAEGSIIADIDQSPIPNSNPQVPCSKSLFNNKQLQQVTSKRAVKSAGTPSEALPKSAWGNQVIELDASQIKATGLSDQVPFCKMKSEHIDQSWMPNWFTNTKPIEDIQDYVSDFEESSSDDDDNQILNRVSLSFDDIPSMVKLSIIPEQNHDEKKQSQQPNSYLSPLVGR